MNHTTLKTYLIHTGFTKEQAIEICSVIPEKSFMADQLVQVIGRALLEQMKHKKFTVKEFAQYLSQHHSITNAKKYLAEGSIERANTIPVLADSIEDRIR